MCVCWVNDSRIQLLKGAVWSSICIQGCAPQTYCVVLRPETCWARFLLIKHVPVYLNPALLTSTDLASVVF